MRQDLKKGPILHKIISSSIWLKMLHYTHICNTDLNTYISGMKAGREAKIMQNESLWTVLELSIS